jgi:hypothetical protein
MYSTHGIMQDIKINIILQFQISSYSNDIDNSHQ